MGRKGFEDPTKGVPMVIARDLSTCPRSPYAMIGSLRRLALAAGFLACIAPLPTGTAAQVLLEEPPRLVLDSLLPRSKAFGQDIVVGDAIYRYQADPMAKGGGSLRARLWPDGRVPYRISSEAPLYAADMERLQSAMRTWERMTDGAVSFYEVSGLQAEPYLEIRRSDRNTSYVGQVQAAQAVHYEPGASFGTYLHELGHAMGLEHEQNRSDRDQFVQVLSENVVDGMIHNFGMTPTRNCTSYDFGSVMHYGPDYFSKNGQPTLLPHPEYAGMRSAMGNRSNLTASDAAELRALYTGVCGAAGPGSASGTGGGSRLTSGLSGGAAGTTGAATGPAPVLRATNPTRWILRGSTVPSADVRAGWAEDLEIVTSARTATEQYVVMSTWHSGIRQSFQDGDVFPTDYVREKWDEGYRIQHAVYGAGGWQVLMQSGMGWGAQSWRKRAFWPKEEIKELWDEGKRITTITYGDGEWFVALTEDTGITEQGWDTSEDAVPADAIRKRFEDGFRVTGLAWGGGSWAVVASKGTDIGYQAVVSGESFPLEEIEKQWSEGLSITSLARSDTQWVVVMSRR